MISCVIRILVSLIISTLLMYRQVGLKAHAFDFAILSQRWIGNWKSRTVLVDPNFKSPPHLTLDVFHRLSAPNAEKMLIIQSCRFHLRAQLLCSLLQSKQHLNGLKRVALTHVVSQQHRWWQIHNEHPRASLTTTSIRSASLTCPSAVCPLTHSSPWVTPEQSRACDSRLAGRHSTHSQIVNPMIQARSRLFPASVSSLLYTLGSANEEQMQENGRPCQLHTDKQPTTSLCSAPASGLRSCRNMSDILKGLPLKEKTNKTYLPLPHLNS